MQEKDDTLSQYTTPLSPVAQPFEQLEHAAVQLVVDRVRGVPGTRPGIILLTKKQLPVLLFSVFSSKKGGCFQ